MLIGVLPASNDCSHPADRRRFGYFFRLKRAIFERADFDKVYDVVYVTIYADLGLWANYKSLKVTSDVSPWVVFDFCDDLLSTPPWIDFLRSIFYYLTGRTSQLSISYNRIVRRMIRASDVIICGSVEQKRELGKIHPNVVIIRDSFIGEIVTREQRSFELRSPGVLNVFWEGLSHGNIACFRLLRQVLDGIRGYQVHLHLVTDLQYCRIGGKFLCRTTYAVLREVFKGSAVRFHLYDWCPQTLGAIASCCDLGVIPIPNNRVMRRKPENKLLLMWSMGLPTITSDTDSYVRVMKCIGEDFAASTLVDWRQKITLMASSSGLRERYMDRAKQYLIDNCSEEAMLSAWGDVFPNRF